MVDINRRFSERAEAKAKKIVCGEITRLTREICGVRIAMRGAIFRVSQGSRWKRDEDYQAVRLDTRRPLSVEDLNKFNAMMLRIITILNRDIADLEGTISQNHFLLPHNIGLVRGFEALNAFLYRFRISPEAHWQGIQDRHIVNLALIERLYILLDHDDQSSEAYFASFLLGQVHKKYSEVLGLIHEDDQHFML
jgi:hypothetical protein